MKAGNKEELMQKLKIWHDENIDTYIKFKESVRKAHNDDMGFFNDNVNMLGFDVQEEIDQSESADIEFFMAGTCGLHFELRVAPNISCSLRNRRGFFWLRSLVSPISFLMSKS